MFTSLSKGVSPLVGKRPISHFFKKWSDLVTFHWALSLVSCPPLGIQLSYISLKLYHYWVHTLIPPRRSFSFLSFHKLEKTETFLHIPHHPSFHLSPLSGDLYSTISYRISSDSILYSLISGRL